MSHTYKTSKKCFIGDAIREAGATFSVPNKIENLPDWLTSTNLTPQEKAAITKAKNIADKKLEEDNAEIAMASNKKVAKPKGEATIKTL